MAKLIYAAICSLDGFIEDATGSFEWAAPDDEVHRFVNGLERGIGTYLYGRRMYDVMQYWESAPDDGDAADHEYARIWRASDKIVYSRTLTEPTTAKTEIVESFDESAIEQMKRDADSDISIGGPEIAAHAIAAGLVDELHLFLNPVAVGAGKRALPDDVVWPLELLDERRFASGVVYLRYRTKS